MNRRVAIPVAAMGLLTLLNWLWPSRVLTMPRSAP